MDLTIRALSGPTPDAQPIEVVERKGAGHPDTICDALAEHIGRRLCRYYQERFGGILHHNVDKLLLCAGSSKPRFGGGKVTSPIELYLGGRATTTYQGEVIPVADLAIEACEDWLRKNLPMLDLQREVEIIPRLRPGASELAALLGRGRGVPRANDTSCGVGFSPLTDLERVVLAVERALNSAEVKADAPAIGTDVKVMGTRHGDRIELTIGCAFIDRFLADIGAYARAKEHALTLALDAARRVTTLRVDAVVNAADDLDRGEIFLTVTGTSAEAGDDGEVGRGNRTSGLITPYRPMTLEAAAGKNPVNHVGKLYSVVAQRIAVRVSEALESSSVVCSLVSRIGQAIDDPALADLQLEAGATEEPAKRLARDIVQDELSRFEELEARLLRAEVELY